MRRRLLERRKLPNGLFLEFWDESRKLAGDCWYVAVRAVVRVPLSEHPLEGTPSTVMEFIVREVGDHLCFQLKEERNFIAEADVAALKDELKEVFAKNSLLPFPSSFPLPLRVAKGAGGSGENGSGKRAPAETPRRAAKASLAQVESPCLPRLWRVALLRPVSRIT